MIVVISMMFQTCGYGISFSCLGKLAQSRAVSKEVVAILLSVGGALEAGSRLLNGWFADRRIVSAMNQYTFSMICYGVSSFAGALVPGVAGEFDIANQYRNIGTY